MRSTFFKNLAALAAIAIIPALVGSFIFYRVLAGQAIDSRLTELEKLAGRFSERVDDFTKHAADDLWVVTQHDGVREAILMENTLTEAQRTGVDQLWMSGEETEADVVLLNEASLFLKAVKDRHALFNEIIATNARGDLAAASNKTTDFVQDDECWWQAPMDNELSRDCVEKISSTHFDSVIMNVERDESSDTNGFDVAQLVDHAGTGKPTGVIKATMSYKVLARAIRSRLTSKFALLNSHGLRILESDSPNKPSYLPLLDDKTLDRLRAPGAPRVIQIQEPVDLDAGKTDIIGAVAKTNTGWFVVTYETRSATLDMVNWNSWLLFIAIALGAVTVSGMFFVTFIWRGSRADETRSGA